MQPDPTMTIRTRIYDRQQWGCTLQVRRDRFKGFDLKDPERVRRTMTRWIRRSAERLGHISGEARVQFDHASMIYETWRIGAVAFWFMSPPPEDRDCLQSLIDDCRAQRVAIPEPAQWPIRS